MPFPLGVAVPLGIALTGKSGSLGAQLFNTDGSSNGALITSGFIERGATGYYYWFYASFPDGFRGGVDIVDTANGNVVLTILSVNPQEAEYSDAKTSLVPGLVWTNATRTLTAAGQGQQVYKPTILNSVTTLPVNGAFVTIRDGLGATVAWGITDLSGHLGVSNAGVGLSPGSYTVIVSAGAGYQLFTKAITITGGSDLTENVSIIPQAIVAPAFPGLCTIQVYTDLNGVPLAGCKVHAWFLHTNQATDGRLQSAQVAEAITDVNGSAQLQLIRVDYITKGDKIYAIEVLDPLGNRVAYKEVRIPPQPTVIFEDLI
jgi:hypothetical protein